MGMLAVCLLLLPMAVGLGPAAARWNTTVCPNRCTCLLPRPRDANVPALHTVDCSKRKLTLVPHPLPANTEALLLRGNGIQYIDLPLPAGLRHIDLSYNSITHLPAMGENLTKVEYLNLQGNRITVLPSATLNGMLNLKTLLLDKNYISKIEMDAFEGLTDLEELSLTDNKLKDIERYWFKGLSRLQTVRLDGNEIKDLCDACFQGAKKLWKLSLSHNYISSIEKGAFSGLRKLGMLNLDNNLLEDVPTAALVEMSDLHNLSLNGNGLKKLGLHDFQYLDVTEILLNNIPVLYSVDRESFYSLQSMVVLEMHDNAKLTFLDSQAFVQCNSLKLLYLQNNNLLALSSNIAASLPNLQSISFYHNPLHCDCNVYWVKEMMGAYHDYYDSFSLTVSNESVDNASVTIPPITFQHAEKFVCDTPTTMNAKLLKVIPLSTIPKSCSPTVIPFFNDSHQRELGDSVVLECRAIGVSTPHIHWILSNGKVVNNTSNYSRVRLDGVGTLRIEHIKAIDAGTYTCVAANENGYDTTSTVLRVHNKDIKIMHKGIATNFITVTWSGTGSTVSSSNYVIIYRRRGTNEEYGKVALRPYMRSYTITNLEPQTLFEFCLGYDHSDRTVKVSCMDIQTKHQLYVMEGMKSVNNLTVVIGISAAASFLLFICVLSVFIKKYRQRKHYKEPEGLNLPGPATVSTSQAGSSHMSQIPLDNLYKPPSTPLCTSTTSLISSSNA